MGFKLANIEGRAALVEGENYYDLETISNGKFNNDTSNALTNLVGLSELSEALSKSEPSGLLHDIKIDAPKSAPKNCYAVGLNYRNHAEEAGMDIPSVPMVFTKHTTCLVGPNSTIEMRSDHVDYEAELVVVIGKSGKDIQKDNAWDHVAGLCAGQDISDRTVQFLAFSYFYKEPKKFSGGELIFPKYDYELTCENNSIIIFPGWVEHGVSKVKIED